MVMKLEKMKLRRLQYLPTEPGWYFNDDGLIVRPLEIRDSTITVHGSSSSREYTGLYVVGNEFDDVPLCRYPGQWSERIPDCDWEGETQVVKPDSKDEVVQEDWEYLFDRWDIWGNHSVSNLVKDNYPAWVGEPCGECSTGWEYFRKPVDQGETRR